jgi:tyrosyl-tRNA synthetase
MTPEEKLQIITRNTEEIVTEKELKELISKKKKPVVYLGTAITGRPHVGYFVWVLKLADFLKAGFKVKLLLADLHGALDGTPWDLLEKRYKYYSKVVPMMFRAIGADIKDFEIVKGSDFQKKENYQFDILQMSTEVSINDCKRAAAEVVKFGDNPKLCGLLYPIMQALDEEYLKVDIQYGGTDQRKIFMFARENLPKIKYKRRIELMTPMIPGLISKKMSASDERSKIDLADDEKTVKDKINSAYCEPGIIKDNGVLAFTKYVLMTIKKDRGEKLIIKRPAKFGGNLEFNTYEELEEAYTTKKLHPLDLKNTVANEINTLLDPFKRQKTEIEASAKEAY